MNSGATPTTALASSRARGTRGQAEARPTRAAAAPSTTAQLLPAVCTPLACTARKRARAARSVGRGWLSWVTAAARRARLMPRG
ncbi:MAG: hypothetical protein LKM38_09195 [Pseudomonas veronii]|nr:hypothetical protein [Pseudomonas veronii]